MQLDLNWTNYAADLSGPSFALFHRELAKFNHRRLQPALPSPGWRNQVGAERVVLQAEAEFVDAVRKAIAPLIVDIPETVEGFIAWFERLRTSGPGQGDPLFPWLATTASADEMKWFL